MVVQNDFVTMWPVVTTGPTAMSCYDWLIGWRRGPDGQFGPQPELAESWELSGNSATFKLRQGVTFHDGSPLNAATVQWNIQQMVTYPKSIAKVALEAIDATKPADVVDDYTVRINLKYADGGLLAALSDAEATTAIVSKAAFDKLGADGLSRQAVGTGPFIFDTWQPNNQLAVKRNPKYWQKGADGQGLPYLDQIIYKTIPDDSVRILQMLSGTSDLTELIRATDIAKVKSTPSLVYDQVAWMGNRYRFVFNAKKPPFGDNLKLRQAVQYAINRDAVAQALGEGVGVPLKYDLNPGQLGYWDTVPYYGFDPAKAKQLVKDAGYPNGLPVRLTVISRQLDVQQAQMLQQMLGDVGIKVTVESLERTAWVKKVREQNDFEMATQRTGTSYDPDPLFTLSWAASGPAAYSRASTPEVEACLTTARSTYDIAFRQKQYATCQTDMYNTAWWGYIWMQPWNYVYNKRVNNVPALWGEEWQEELLWKS